MEGGTTGPIHFLNLEYFFQLIYGSRVEFTSGNVPGAPRVTMFEAFSAWLGDAWGILGIVSFLFVLIAFGILIYASVRLYQIRHQEDEEKYSTLAPEVAEKQKDHARWAHVRQLIESSQPNDWRQAIIEADIMLEEVLEQAGYTGATMSERLKNARFNSIQEAGEAHGVRNRIAHDGMAFKLDDNDAYRTIQKYERVFKEFGEI